MLAVARTLSLLSVLLTVLAIDSVRVHLLPLGFEATGYVAGLSFYSAVLFALHALVIVVPRARSGARAGFALVAHLPRLLSGRARRSITTLSYRRLGAVGLCARRLRRPPLDRARRHRFRQR